MTDTEKDLTARAMATAEAQLQDSIRVIASYTRAMYDAGNARQARALQRHNEANRLAALALASGRRRLLRKSVCAECGTLTEPGLEDRQGRLHCEDCASAVWEDWHEGEIAE